MSWDELLDHGDEPFDVFFPRVRGVRPSLTLKATVVHACDDQDGALLNSLIDCEIARHTDAGHAQFAKYVTSETVSHLNNAVEHFRLVLGKCPVSHPDHATALTNLAWARLKGYSRDDLQEIDATTSLFRDALALRPQPHPDHPLSLYNLTEALNWRHDKKSTDADIRESAQLYHELLPLCPEGTYLRSIAAGENDASDEGIHLRRVVLELCPLGHRLRPRALDELAGAVRARFIQHGSIDDLDTSIELRREAVSLCSEEHDTYLNNLAYSLMLRFEHQGNPNDLDEAISLHEEALRLRPLGHESRDSSLDNLGGILLDRFKKRGDIDDINRAISLLREALTLCPPGHPYRHTTLNNLALALNTRYKESHVSEDLNEAIDLFRESLRSRPLDDPDRHVNLHNLSSALRSRFTQSQKNEDVKEAITLCQESLADLSSLHPNRYFSYTRLQEAYLSRYEILHDPADLLLAIENFRLASRHPTQGYPDRILEAIDWAYQAEAYQHDSALEAYQMCFELFDSHLTTRSSTISRREAAAAFHYARSLPVDAASYAIHYDNLQHAVELVEHGRGQQWSLASRLRTPVEALESANPTLAHNYLQLSKRVSDAAQSSATITDRAAADRAATEYRKFVKEWEDAVAKIRDLPAFSRFLLPPSYKDLQEAARQGLVIVLIASQYSCSAIIVPTSGDPHHVPFPSNIPPHSTTFYHLTTLKDRFARAIRDASRMDPAEPRKDLMALLRTVWDEIMLPIVNVLEQVLKIERRSRIWLCPTAAFTSIPLHAAHPFKTKPDRSKEPCLEDLYICSYTPTLSALVRSRQLMKKRISPSFVAIGQGQPGAGKGKALLAVDSELELVHKLIPATAHHTTISGDAATRAGSRAALPFAFRHERRESDAARYHGERHSTRRVSRSYQRVILPVGDEETPDEVIHLAAGLQFSGFKSVIGTLWQVDDAVAKHVVEAFYQSMFESFKKDGVMDCTKAAWALNRATHCCEDESAARAEDGFRSYCYLIFVYSVVFLSPGMFTKSQEFFKFKVSKPQAFCTVQPRRITTDAFQKQDTHTISTLEHSLASGSAIAWSTTTSLHTTAEDLLELRNILKVHERGMHQDI
ncbi:uncharacterized protein EDB93DRAFT_1298115 [Suillus bovinus]|uniref:uncharacterized protein n=1 Tax=Suillus bovinus TaxID=48563 RepID=UPI001B860FA2|nr:uncharacterized protein EDB93DRAFT_1298115 [Suillus bovinus]KAG2139846.1 hypothetical protein EDB93DRAFT_1298115 [Suillus bovinus]